MHGMMPSAILGLAGIAAATAVGISPATAAESIADFYKGKTIRMVVGSEPGGGYDNYARLIVRHMGRHIPGNPQIIAQNMPGAGGITAANHVYNVAPQDGTVIGGIQRGTPFVQILGEPGPQFEAVKFNYLGSLNNEVGVIYTWNTSKVKTFDDLLKNEIFFGSSGPNDTEIYPAMLTNMLGAKIKLISGYPAATAISLAIERGEIEGLSQSWTSVKTVRPHWFNSNNPAENKVNVIAQISMSKHPDLPNVPLIMDLITPKNLLPAYTMEESETFWRIMLAQKSMGRPFILGPGVPADRVAALRKAFDDMLVDKEFIAEADKSKSEIVPVGGEEIQNMVARLATAPRAALDKLSDVTKYRGQVQQAKVEKARHVGKVTKSDEGRKVWISHEGKEVDAALSASRTKISIDGKEGKREQVLVGMTCTFVYDAPGAEAEEVICTK